MEEIILHLIKKSLAPIFLKTQVRRMLDCGCADGKLTMAIKRTLNVTEAYGVDINSKAIKVAKNLGIKGFVVNLNYMKLPFDDDFFDLVIMIRVIEHLMNPDNAVSEVYRVLRTGGLLIIATPNQASWFNRLLLLLGHPILGIDLSTKWRYHYPLGVTQVISGHVRLYTVRALKQLLSYYGFKVLKVKGYPQVSSKTRIKGRIFIYALDRFFAIKPTTASNIFMACQKI